MEVVKLSSKGQITIPISIRNKLHLKTGDKIVFHEENGRFYLENSALIAFDKISKDFENSAKEAGFDTEDDIQEHMKEIRNEVRGINL